MPSYQLVTSARTTSPDFLGLLAALRAAVAPELGIQLHDVQHYVLKKTADWTSGEIATAQTTIDSAPGQTLQLDAQHDIDAWPIELKALALALIDALNVIRAALPSPLPAITPQQAISAVRAKAGTL
jgi:hypothetical protein